MGIATDLYFDARINTQVLRISAGEYAATNQAVSLFTVLGSCVAVCLTDLEMGVVGMNHFILPEPDSAAIDRIKSSPNDKSARYGAHAMELLINKCMSLGARRSHLKAKLFGGASVLNNLTDIGSGNITFAQNYLRTERIPIVMSEVGGLTAYRLYLHGPSGDVTVERLNQLKKLTQSEDRARTKVTAISSSFTKRVKPEFFMEINR